MWLSQIAETAGQLDTPYRPEGGTVRQIVHHMADSHVNSYVRFRLALTEDEQVIRPYREDLWAHGIRFTNAGCYCGTGMIVPPSGNGLVTLEKNVALYAWHGRHHMAHITSLKSRMGWS